MIGTIHCVYETPCGWCAKWDKKCNKEFGKDTRPEKRILTEDNMSPTATHTVRATTPDWFTGGDRGDILG